MKLYRAEEIRKFDQIAIEKLGIPGVVLMENAGRGAAEFLLEKVPSDILQRGIAVFAGAGNNGGDGYVIARHLRDKGFPCRIFLTAPREKIRGDADINLKILENTGETILPCHGPEDFEKYRPLLSESGVIVDALFGTGLKRELKGWPAELIERLNSLRGPVKMAVDIPSGLDANTGWPKPIAFRADLTPTFAGAKIGLLLPQAAPYVGELRVIPIGIPQKVLDEGKEVAQTNAEFELQMHWKRREFNAHKGTYGHLLIVGGQLGKAGAPLLSGLAAMRSGVGLATLACEESVTSRIEGIFPDLMCESFPDLLQDDDLENSIPWRELGEFEAFPPQVKENALKAWEKIRELSENKTALLIGPGFGQSATRKALLLAILDNYKGTVIVDADGLNLLAGNLSPLKKREFPLILTPHPGEMGRLLGIGAREVQRDRLSSAEKLAAETGATAVLKGARTVIASPTGKLWINLTGNPNLAKAGTGDVLAGIISALAARGLEPTIAARIGVFVHGRAADRLLERESQHSLLPRDLIEILPRVFKEWEN